MNTPGGTEVCDHETEMRPAKGLAYVVPVLALLGAHLFFTAVFTAVLTLFPALALVSVWTYITVLPFAFLAVLCLVSRIEAMVFVKYPAVVCTALAPFITWYVRTACQSNYFAICLMLLCVSVVWLLQSVNRFFEKVSSEWLDGEHNDAFVTKALRLSFKSVIYFVIAPLCADLVGIIYRARESDAVLPYIIDNLAAFTPATMALLHYGGLVFTLFFESAIAVSMAYRIMRNYHDRTNHSIGLLD